MLALRFSLIGLVVVLAQWLVLGRLDMFGAYPDAVLLFVGWVALQTGRRSGAVFGFAAGLLTDAVYDTWGMYMLLKTLVGFTIGMFAGEEPEAIKVTPRQALLGGLAIALLHNGLLVAFLAVQTGAATLGMLLSLWIGSALYTGFVAFLAALFATR